MATNPFFEAWSTPFGAPPFGKILPEHFAPAFERALGEHRQEIRLIAENPEAATFANTVEALELSGASLQRVNHVFWNLAGADTNETLQAVERDISPVLARHWSDIAMNKALFARTEALFSCRDTLGLTPEQRRVLEKSRSGFVRAGAMLVGDDRARFAAISERLAVLGTRFGQNILTDERAWFLVLEAAGDREGLPDFILTAAARAASDRGLPGKHVITLSRSSVEPFLQFSPRRDLREKAFAAWIARGENGGETDNRAIIAETVALRAERARLLGYRTYADYKLDDTMAKTPGAVRDLLMHAWTPALARAAREEAELQEMARSRGDNGAIMPSDWRYYAEAVRQARHNLDESAIKPYFPLPAMIEAAFHTATRLFGLTFNERHDIPLYHPDARIWEVNGAEGAHVGLFIGDFYARASKRSGAWMSSFRDQKKLGGDMRPVIVNVMNFSAPPAGEVALLSFDDARTLFHEFGHGLHGLLSDVVYPSVAGTNVARDFVELPSQLFEHWLCEPEILRRFARHYRTGEPMPDALLGRLLAARNFNQGHATVEYTASALVDLAFHEVSSAETLDVMAFEQATLDAIGMPASITMRHRTPHFAHVFSGEGYSAGYYSYLWSEVLDADAFRAFEETGNVFDPALARRLHDFVYSAGSRQDEADAYKAFRGRMPTVDAMLEKRGLKETAA